MRQLTWKFQPNYWRRISLLGLLLFPCAAVAQDPRPAITVVHGAESRDYEKNRRMLVGPGRRQPKPYPGYAGFVGWASVIRTRSGALLVTFSSGYWHASPPLAHCAVFFGIVGAYDGDGELVGELVLPKPHLR